MNLIPALDLFPLLASVLVLVGCTLLGNFLVLRRQSLMGDALSHTVLPGVVGAYLVFGSRDPLGLFLGALVAGLLTVISIEALRRYGRVESNTAMGVVFSIAFAIGVILIRVGHTDHVDLDPNCVLYGQLELLVWFDAPVSFRDVGFTDVYHAMPSSIWSLLIMVTLSALFVVICFKELRLVSFDPGLARTLGFSSSAINMVLMLLVSVATVASFEAVGSVLVIAALLVPASTARLFTDRLKSQILVSVLVALGSAILGYLLSTWIPLLWQGESLKASGTITVVSGVVFVGSLMFSPRHGYWVQWAVPDSLPIKSRSRTWLFCCTSPMRLPRPSRGPPLIPESLPWPANGACFNHLLLVNTFSLTRDGPWPLKSRPGGPGGSRIWSPKWGWPLIMLRRRLSTWNTSEMISFRNQPAPPVTLPNQEENVLDGHSLDLGPVRCLFYGCL